MVSNIPNEYEFFLKKSLWSLDGTLNDIATPGQSKLGIDSNEEVPFIL